MKYPGHPLLGTSKEQVWRDHVNYILGPEGRGVVSKNMDGSISKSPIWELVLYYHQELFNTVAEQMNEDTETSGSPLPSLTIGSPRPSPSPFNFPPGPSLKFSGGNQYQVAVSS